MSAPRRILLLLLLLLLAVAPPLMVGGCAAANREEHSLVIQKPAHRYRAYTDAELKAMAVLNHAAPAPPSTPAKERAARSELIRSGPQLGPLEGFRPFAYCYLHETDHAAESVVAVAAAPVEYPLAVGTTITVNFVKYTAIAVNGLWSLIFPPVPERDAPERPPEKPADR